VEGWNFLHNKSWFLILLLLFRGRALPRWRWLQIDLVRSGEWRWAFQDLHRHSPSSLRLSLLLSWVVLLQNDAYVLHRERCAESHNHDIPRWEPWAYRDIFWSIPQARNVLQLWVCHFHNRCIVWLEFCPCERLHIGALQQSTRSSNPFLRYGAYLYDSYGRTGAVRVHCLRLPHRPKILCWDRGWRICFIKWYKQPHEVADKLARPDNNIWWILGVPIPIFH